jgi:hypothetical protein
MSTNQLLIWRELTSMKVANHLSHIDSELCWCDPIVEVDESGSEVMVHKEVTWN